MQPRRTVSVLRVGVSAGLSGKSVPSPSKFQKPPEIPTMSIRTPHSLSSGPGTRIIQTYEWQAAGAFICDTNRTCHQAVGAGIIQVYARQATGAVGARTQPSLSPSRRGPDHPGLCATGRRRLSLHERNTNRAGQQAAGA